MPFRRNFERPQHQAVYVRHRLLFRRERTLGANLLKQERFLRFFPGQMFMVRQSCRPFVFGLMADPLKYAVTNFVKDHIPMAKTGMGGDALGQSNELPYQVRFAGDDIQAAR